MRGKREEVTKYMEEYDVVVISEVKMRERDNLKFSGFRTYHKLREEGRMAAGGILILVKNKIGQEAMGDVGGGEETIESLGVRIRGEEGRMINLIGIYRKPGKRTRKESWINVIRRAREENSIMMVGDFNAKHRIWNCEVTDKNGENLEEAMEQENLYIINSDTKT